MKQQSTVALVSLLALLASACAGAGETQERPATAPSASLASPAPSPLPLPESAFHGDEEAARPSSPSSPSSPLPLSRFDTRRIGASLDERDGDGVTSASKRFRGAAVDVDLKSADLANVFRLLADVGHVNIVVAGDVTGTVTLRLKHVPWDQALDLVARTHGLELQREGNVIVVRAGQPQRVSSTIHDDGR